MNQTKLIVVECSEIKTYPISQIHSELRTRNQERQHVKPVFVRDLENVHSSRSGNGDTRFQPHPHVIVTEGGLNGKKCFIQKRFFPARPFAGCRRYPVSRKLQEAGIAKKVSKELYLENDAFYV